MLTVTLVCVGRLKSGSEHELASRYLERARQSGRGLGLAVELKELTESRARRPIDRKLEEAHEIRAALGERRSRMIVFDEQGQSFDSLGFAGLIDQARDRASAISFVIGGPDGIDAELRSEAAQVVAFGSMTWPHQIVRILAAEQIYRAMTLLSGHPYHRG